MRTVDQTLLDAIANQQGETILRVLTWADLAAYNAAPSTPEATFRVRQFTIQSTAASALIVSEDNDYTVADFTVFIIERGVSIQGIEYTIQSDIFFVSNFIEKPGYIKLDGSSFPIQKVIIDGDDTYENVITAFCTAIGKTAVFKDNSEAWLQYQFFPTGKQVILNKAERFESLIRQKYGILIYARSPKELVFFSGNLPQSAWSAISYAEDQNKIVIVGTSGDHGSAYSNDGVSWTKVTTPAYCKSVTYSPTLNLFVAVKWASNTFMSSPDGITWTTRTAPESAQWESVCWSEEVGLFVAVNYNGSNKVATSTDGINWTGRAGVGTQWLSVCWTNILSLYVSVGSSVCATSPDGINWTSRTIPAGIYNAITYGNILVAVGFECCATSPDGINWTSRTIQAEQWNGITYSNSLDLFVAVGDGVISTSPDGITWTARTVPTSNNWSAVIWDGNQFIITSENGTYRIATSTDGITWVLQTVTTDFSLSYDDGPSFSVEHGLHGVHYLWRDETASINTDGDLDLPQWNLGYLESTANPPSNQTDPFYKFTLQKAPVQLDITDGDILHFDSLWALDPARVVNAQIIITEQFNVDKSPYWYQDIKTLTLFESVEGGSLPSTIERVSAYTPLVSSGFDGNLNTSVNNLQALAEAVDDLTISSYTPPATTAANDFQVGDGAGNWIKSTLAATKTILGIFADAASDSIYYVRRNAAWTNLKTYTDTLYALITHSHAASDVTSGTMATARLGSGTANSSTFLRGDQTWATPASGTTLTYNNSTITTADVTGAVDNVYNCTIAGLTANRNLTIPTASGAGKIVRVVILDGDNTYALIIKGASTVTINGGSAATEWSRLFVIGESVTLESTSTTNWQVIEDNRVPCRGRLRRAAAQSIADTASGSTQIQFDNTDVNIGDIADLANYRFVVRRAGQYLFSGSGGIQNITDRSWVRCDIYLNGAIHSRGQIYLSAAAASTTQIQTTALIDTLAAGDLITLQMEQNTGGAQNTGTAVGNRPNLHIMEIL